MTNTFDDISQNTFLTKLPYLCIALHEHGGSLPESEVLKIVEIDNRLLYYCIGKFDELCRKDNLERQFVITIGDDGEYIFNLTDAGREVVEITKARVASDESNNML